MQSGNAQLICFTLLFGLLLVARSDGQSEELRLANTATYVRSGTYKWTVFLTGSSSALDQVDYVVYTLHPTFPKPVHKITDRRSNFSLSASGWGEFNITATVVGKDGRQRFLEHWLDFRREPPPEPKFLETWTIQEGPKGEWTGKWTIVRTTEEFSCSQQTTGSTLTATCVVIREGDFVAAQKFQVSDGNPCNYFGRQSGNKISGQYFCKSGGPYDWSATVSK